jgi:formate/nitrite transporter FocA (FNT family)
MNKILNAVIAGFLVSIASALALTIDDPIGAAFIFAAFLAFVIARDFNLVTSKVHLFLEKKSNPKNLLLMFFGNIIGTLIAIMILRGVRLNGTIMMRARAVVNERSTDTIFSVIVMSILAGLSMYILYNAWAIYKSIVLTIAIGMAIWLCGFEESISECFIFVYTNGFTARILLIVIGNIIGSLLIPLSERIE